jgi:hypothetical protein
MIAITRYCERSGDAFWAEPANALTNIAFLVAALLAARLLANKRSPRQWEIAVLVLLMVLTGMGSFLWHTLATPWAGWADIIPIVLFISVYLVAFLVRVTGLQWFTAGFLLTLYVLLVGIGLAMSPVDRFNGSLFYLPVLAALLLMAVYCRVAGRRQAGILAVMSALFAVSLLLRTVDAGICAVFPLGTHFAWHLLNAALMYLAVRSLVH